MLNSSLVQYLNRIERVLRTDEQLMRLLKYRPEDETHPDPLDSSLPNVVTNDSDLEYWSLVEEKLIKGIKNFKIELNSTVLLYFYEGRNIPVPNNPYLSNQEIRFSIFIHEDFETDSRISRISSRISTLLANRGQFVGYGQLRPGPKNPSSAPIEYRHQIDTYVFTTNTRDGKCLRIGY